MTRRITHNTIDNDHLTWFIRVESYNNRHIKYLTYYRHEYVVNRIVRITYEQGIVSKNMYVYNNEKSIRELYNESRLIDL